MVDIKEFIGEFGDFSTMAHDVDIKNYVFCSYGPEGDVEMYKMIVGYTVLPYDVLLHVIDVEDAKDNFTVSDHVDHEGVQLVFLKDFIGKFGVEVHPDFQLGAKPKEGTPEEFD